MTRWFKEGRAHAWGEVRRGSFGKPRGAIVALKYGEILEVEGKCRQPPRSACDV